MANYDFFIPEGWFTMTDKYNLIPDNEKQIYENLPLAFFVFQLINGKYSLLAVSNGMCSMLGYSRKEICELFEKGPSAYIHPDDLQHTVQTFFLYSQNAAENHTALFRIKKAPDIWLLISCQGETKKLEDGSSLAYVQCFDMMHFEKTYKKMTENQHINEPFESKNEQLAHIIDNIPAGMGICRIENKKTLHLTVNRYFTEITGITNEDLLSCGDDCMLAFVHSDDKKRAKAECELFFSGQKSFESNYRFRQKSTGRYIWMHVMAKRVELSSDSSVAYFAYTDIDNVKKTEEAMRESQRLYKEAVDAAKLSIWKYEPDTERIIMTDSLYTKAICSKFHIPNIIENGPENLAAVIDKKDRPAFLAMYKKAKDGAARAECEFSCSNYLTGEKLCEHLILIGIQDENGKNTVVYGIGQDITSQKLQEEKYSLAYKQLDEAHPYTLGSFHLDLTSNWCGNGKSPLKFVLKQQQNGTVDGYFSEFSKLIADEDVKEEFFKTFERQHLLELFRLGQTKVSIQYPIIYENGERHWREGLLFMLQNPHTGNVEAVTYAMDIDRQKKNELIMNRITTEDFDYIGIINPVLGSFEFCHKHSSISFGTVNEKIDYNVCRSYVAKNFVDADESRHFYNCTALENILSSLRSCGKYAASYKRTENKTMSVRHLQYCWLEKPEGDILVIRTNITAAYEQEQERLRQMQEALFAADKANEAKSMFLSSMSHDLRTPLNGIIGFTNLAIKEQDAAKKQDYLEKIESSGNLLLSLVNDTLELSRIDSGKVKLEMENCSSKELVLSVITALAPSAKLKGIVLNYNCEQLSDEMIFADKLKLQKIFLNLISNAIKFTPAGGTVNVFVSQYAEKSNGYILKIIVEDTGIGISPEFLPDIFEPFAQEHRQENINVMGTGLGLAIIKQILNLMDGKIYVESTVGKGSRFTVEIPVEKSDSAPKADTENVVKDISLSGKHILLCEDNHLNAEIASILLKEKGMTVEWAKNGSEACRMFEAMPDGFFDAILMDIRMPIMNGYEASRAIRNSKLSYGRFVPIIAMTADAFDEDRLHAKQAGMNGYVTKPVDPCKLFFAITEYVSKK